MKLVIKSVKYRRLVANNQHASWKENKSVFSVCTCEVV